jgi:hypothetical protein
MKSLVVFAMVVGDMSTLLSGTRTYLSVFAKATSFMMKECR